MRTLLVVFLTLLFSCLFYTLGYADKCSDYKQRTGLDLNEAECYVLEKVEKGKEADLKRTFPKEADRVLRADFVKKLLTDSLSGIKVKEIGLRILHAKVSGTLNIIEEKIPFAISLNGFNFEKSIKFIRTAFSNTEFRTTTFSGKATFTGSTFEGSADFVLSKFLKEADFNGVKFRQGANFRWCQFFGSTGFVTSNFIKSVGFVESKFFERTEFLRAKFFGKVNFDKSEFLKEALFIESKFFDDSSFISSRFNGWTHFNLSEFSRRVDFSKATFMDKTSFTSCRFFDESKFIACRYDFDTKVTFDNVTDFSNMKMEWYYNSKRFTKETNKKISKLRGIKQHLEHNETFYVALIKNFRNLGWFTEADDAYYTYRVEKREMKGFWSGLVERLFLEVTFGYGVKPGKLLLIFMSLWIIPSVIYFHFMTFKPSFPIPSWWFSGNPLLRLLRFPWRLFQSRLSWALIHSLDTLTPGVNFKSMETLSPYDFDSKKAVYIERIHQIFGWYLLALFLILFSRVWIR